MTGFTVGGIFIGPWTMPGIGIITGLIWAAYIIFSPGRGKKK